MRIYWLFLACFIASNLFSQSPNHCGTDHWIHKHVLSDPQAKAEFDRLNAAWTQASGARVTGGGNVRKIPVVVHLIQSNANGQISDDRVHSQITVLNEDFRKLNADTTGIPAVFQGVASDTRIEFCLATIDPNGCPTTGINRVISPANAVHDMNDEAQLKALIQWPPRKYLNIWVPESTPSLLGYATFPTQLNFAPGLDGVVINGQNFGRGFGTPPSSYSLGRTATHEIGHWLGLFHTFQGGCAGTSASNCSTQGDLICDTPPTANSNFGCPSNLNTCTESPTDQPDQINNYMDYGDDPCLFMFTMGQADRMYFFLDNARSQLWSPANLTATGCDGTVSAGCTPQANFKASTLIACTGAPVDFTDLTIGVPTAWNWTFSGATPNADTIQNPTVVYDSAGLYDVSLTVTNSFGTDTETRFGHILVVDPQTAPLVESFENILFYPQGWGVEDEDGTGSWQVVTTVSSQGQNSMVMPNFTLQAAGSKDALVSRPIDLSGMGAATLTYDRAYKRKSAFAVDSLRVDVSTDCGTTWTRVRQLQGNTLLTTTGFLSANAYVPTPTQWVKDTIDLTPFAGSSAVKIRFEFKSGGGQNLYLDEVNLDAVVSRNQPSDIGFSCAVFPSPSDGSSLDLMLELKKSAPVCLRLFSVSGQEMGALDLGKWPAGKNVRSIRGMLPADLAPGVYFIQVQAGDMHQTRKWIVQPSW